MYKINVYDVELDGGLILLEDSCRRYEYIDEARQDLMMAMINALDIMVKVSHEQQLFTNAFTIDMDTRWLNRKYDGALRLWNIPGNILGEPCTLYEIVWEDESAEDEFNKKLKDKYGDNITTWIRSEFIEDEDFEEEDCAAEIEKYYFEGARCPKSELYDTPEEAYEKADYYMRNIELFVDCD